MSSTLINNLEDIETITITILDEEKLSEYILDLSLDDEVRLEAFEKYYEKNEDNTIEILSRLSGMYQFSGAKILRQFLYNLCMKAKISSFLKLEAVKSLLSFEEPLEDSDIEDEEEFAQIKKKSNDAITERNEYRKSLSFTALNHVCSNIEELATPCRVEAVCMLMENTEYKEQANEYFKNIILDQKIECDFRYKTILSLENKNIESEYFLRSACITFLTDVGNRTMYRILAGQYLLQKCTLTENVKELVEQTLLGFAEERCLDYNLRADAADTLLSLASEEIKSLARKIILELGRAEGDVKTIFDNAQNVHTDSVEESVADVLEFLSTINILEINETPIDFEFVFGKVEKILSDRECIECKNKKDEDYCSKECIIQFQKHKNIRVALNRICMDRVLYSKFNNTLVNILLKIWTYLTNHEHKEQMTERLLEELNEMSGTCSTGFASRLVNVISGFGQFNIRMSWEEQIIANFTGRLNALARKITDKDSPYFGNKLEDVVKLWLNNNVKIKNSIAEDISKSIHITYYPSMKMIVDKYLEDDRDVKVSVCVDDFSMLVLNEMMLPSSQFQNRQNFLLFFRTSMLAIREEMYEEFKGLITDVDFDLFFRKAIMVYEGNI